MLTRCWPKFAACISAKVHAMVLKALEQRTVSNEDMVDVGAAMYDDMPGLVEGEENVLAPELELEAVCFVVFVQCMFHTP